MRLIFCITQLSKITKSGGLFGSFWTINESCFVTDKECTPVIDQECVGTIMIKTSSISSRHQNSYKNIRVCNV